MNREKFSFDAAVSAGWLWGHKRTVYRSVMVASETLERASARASEIMCEAFHVNAEGVRLTLRQPIQPAKRGLDGQ